MRQFYIIFLISVIVFSCSKIESGSQIAGPEEIDKYLQVPSPEWEDQIIYFIITDLFNDGDMTNNDQGAGEYIPGSEIGFNGGDLKGITDRIGYIKELGATAIWITPPVANQWWHPDKTFTGRHGYWATNFIEVDKHFGTLEDYRHLSASLHKNGMYLIQDVVVNHTGDFFTYTGEYDPEELTKNFTLRDVPQMPTQYPFDRNNANNPEDLEMAVYHFTPTITDYFDLANRPLYQFADLDDLNTSNQLVRDVLKRSFNFWIGEAGVDGFRYDTPIYVEHDFWHDFSHSTDPEAPGVETYAASLGKDHFLAFGETGIQTLPFDDRGTLEVASYLGSEEKPEMNSVINYPLFNSIQKVFAEMQPTNLLSYRLESIHRIFPHPEYMTNLIDDHNGERFLSRGSHSSFRQAMLFIMTIPGIPVIYYGTEHDFKGAYRQAMFKGGLGSPDHDHFDTGTESFKFLQNLINARKEHKILRRGKPKILVDESGGPGLLGYNLSYDGNFAIVLFNTSEREKLAAGIQTKLEPGTGFETIYCLSGKEYNVTVDNNGNISLFLPPKEGLILFPYDDRSLVSSKEVFIGINPLDGPVSKDKMTVTGQCSGVREIFVAVNGDLKSAVQTVVEDGSWSVDVPLQHFMNGTHQVIAYSVPDVEQGPLASDPVEFELELPELLVATVKDPPGDDHGPEGNYSYPLFESFNRQLDIEAVNIYSMGSNMKIEMQMAEVTEYWMPPNGFDHALVNIFIDLPGKSGAESLPYLNVKFPGGGGWDYMVSTSSHINLFCSSEGATDESTGEMSGTTPVVTANPEERKISFIISSESLDYPATLSGTRIYITTWSGTPVTVSPLKPEAEDWSFGGGDESAPKIMDDTDLFILK